MKAYFANQHTNPWPEEAIKWLKKNYYNATIDQLREFAKKENRTFQALTVLAYKMGLKRNPERVKESISLGKGGKKYLPLNSHLKRKIQKAKNIKEPEREIKIPYNKLIKIVIASDSHIPFQSEKAHLALLKFLKKYKPEILVYAGDLIDFYQISKFRTIPFTPTSLEEELNTTRNFLEKIREILPKAQIYLVEGNHEFRWRTYLIEKASAFYNLFSFKLTDLLGLENLNINYIPCRPDLVKFSHNYVKIGNFYIGHFDKNLKNAAYTARLLRDEFGSSIIQGHTHKAGISYRTYLNEVKLGAEIGCLCKLNPAFLNNPDWQNAFAILELKNNISNFQLKIIQ